MKKTFTLIVLILLISALSFGCTKKDSTTNAINQIELNKERRELLNEKEKFLDDKEENLKERESQLYELKAKLEENDEQLSEATKNDKVDGNDEGESETGSIELIPNEEGFYNGVYYSGDFGIMDIENTHTPEQARELGYRVDVITRNEYGYMFINLGSDTPFHLSGAYRDDEIYYPKDYQKVSGNEYFDPLNNMTLYFEYTIMYQEENGETILMDIYKRADTGADFYYTYNFPLSYQF